ncbi:MAG: MATE family efflux transporter [Clostridia bacterium]|nr:MATE family efflux transporter [Clostridia bacterium]
MNIIKNASVKNLALFSLTWPIFIEILLRMLLGNVDTIMLSRYSDNAVASVGVSNQIITMIIVLYSVVSSGATVLISQYLGAQRKEKASEVAGASLTLSLLFGLILSLILVVMGRGILKAMNVPDELMGDSLQFLRIVGGMSFIQALIAAVSAIIRSHGNTRVSMYVAVGMNILNVIGNSFFVFGLAGAPILGVTGVAISTTFSQTAGLIVMLVLMVKHLKLKISLGYIFPIPKEALRNILKIGIPSAAEGMVYNISQLAITYIINMIGTTALTTKVYAWNIMWFVMLFGIAIGQGTQIINGHYIGAGENDKAYKTCLRSLKIALLVSLGMAALIAALSKPLMGIFTKDPAIISLGSSLLLLTLFLETGRAFNVVINNSLRAAGDAKFPVYMGVLSMLGVSVTLSYVLGISFDMGLIGIWIALSVDEWIRGLIMLWRWRSRVWEKMSFVKNEKLQKAA